MLTSTHWGTYRARVAGDRLLGLDPVSWDHTPSPIGQSIAEGIVAPCRVRRPAVREGFLKDRGASRERRGCEPFVEVSWEEATRLVAEELRQVIEQHGNEAIFGGSYGWSSAGRFHHAQSQVHRFLNSIGGYSYFKDTYSNAAARRVLPHVVGNMDELRHGLTTWSNLAEHCEMFVAFGGLPTRNTQVNSGGATDHAVPQSIRSLAARGVEFVNISPVRHDLETVPARWMPIRPGSDTAFILACCHVLISEGLFDRAFVDKYTVGFEKFADYVTGKSDGQPKTCEWAAPLTEIEAGEIRALARRMASKRTMINMTWALQRAAQGEQPFWGMITLAALLGQIGTPGGGFAVGYTCMNDIGSGRNLFSGPRLPQGPNPVQSFIPVARFTDMLLNPNGPCEFDGGRYSYPDIHFIYWAGGNAFHHHQDINRMIGAWRKPQAIVVHEQFWTAQAKFADIVLPATTAVERADIGSSGGDGFMIAMKQLVKPIGEARDDYRIFAEIAAHIGREQVFTEGRSTMDWLRWLYEESRSRGVENGITLPEFDAFWETGHIEYPWPDKRQVFLEDFRSDPKAHKLRTPSGLIELFSEEVAGFGYQEAPGHAYWQPNSEMLGSERAKTYPLHMLSNQPESRLHSQYDHGKVSRASKVSGREPITISTEDAELRGIRSGDVVRVFNDRGAILAGAKVTDGMRPGVVQLATGAWYDPLEAGVVGTLDKHGNPNVLTKDIGTSRLGQGCAAQSALVQIERWTGEVPAVTAFEPPEFVPRIAGVTK
jgi:biotin/methionine sulfoxide reductase